MNESALWSALVIRLENALKGHGAEISALQHKVETETGQSMVSLARIPHLENSLYLICVEP